MSYLSSLLRLVQKHLLALAFFTATVACPFPTYAQVVNDNIENRLHLKIDVPVTSSTQGCTVQWGCVDEKLTGKCIDYHNDQWFEFTPTQTGRYFVNIQGQECRDIRGVQLVVLRGEPCVPTTYQILSCTSLGNQDDVFIVVDLLVGQPYLLNIDGYLQDFCQFSLEVSQQPKGSPANNSLATIAATPPAETGQVVLEWVLPDSLSSTQEFRILKWQATQPKSIPIMEVPVMRNTSGQITTAYQYTDSLTAPGHYFYQVLAESPESSSVVVHQQRYHFKPLKRPASILLPLKDYPNGAELVISVYDAASNRLLWNRQITKSGVTDNRLPASKYQQQGITKVRVKIQHHKSRGRVESREILAEVPVTVE